MASNFFGVFAIPALTFVATVVVNDNAGNAAVN